MSDAQKMTRNQRLVLDVLEAAKQPQSAYDILAQLREKGLKAPPQVYRALEKLCAHGSAHRLETLNKYVACSHGHRHADAAIFAICQDCGDVSEMSDSALTRRLSLCAKGEAFQLDRSTVELHGLCADCAGRQS